MKKALQKIFSILDWIGETSLLENDFQSVFRARMMMSAAFLGALFSSFYVIRNVMASKAHFYIFWFLFLSSLACLIGRKVFKISIDIISLFGVFFFFLTLNLFLYKEMIFYGSTHIWFMALIVTSHFLIGPGKTFILTFIQIGLVYFAHIERVPFGLTVPNTLPYEVWAEHYLFNKITAYIFIYVIVYFFIKSKQRSQELLLEAKETVLKQQESVFKNSRLAELGQLAGGIAHEVNTPLTVIQGSGRRIRRALENQDKPDLEKIEDSLHKIDITSDRIHKIIVGLKTFSRDGSQDPFEKVSLPKLCEEVSLVSEERLRKENIKLFMENHCRDEFVMARSTQLYQALINLINNSIDAIKEFDPAERWIKILVEDSKEKINISVVDSGPGIPDEILEKVLQPFFTTKEAGVGTGLGLSIVDQIMNEHKGELLVDKSFNDSRITLKFPLRQELE